MSTDSLKTQLADALEDRGYRLTEPRLQLLSRIEDRSDAFTAEELCQELPQIGRATVYRTIRLLVDTGALCKLPMPEGAPMYSQARAEHHHHTVCVQCGAVGEFRHGTVERAMRSLARGFEGEIVGHRMELFVRCAACLAARN